MEIIKIIHKYHNKPHTHGVYDCVLMMLEYTGFDISKVEPYHTLKGAFKSLRKASGYRYPVDYIQSIGFVEISPLEASDGCLVIDSIHCGIYFNSCVFSLNASSQTFQLNNFSLEQQLNMRVYKWQH